MGLTTMRDRMTWAAHFRERATECTKLAETSFDETIEANYRLLAERYLKLAEAEEAPTNRRDR